jgi:hypothetical protein
MQSLVHDVSLIEYQASKQANFACKQSAQPCRPTNDGQTTTMNGALANVPDEQPWHTFKTRISIPIWALLVMRDQMHDFLNAVVRPAHAHTSLQAHKA